MTGLPRAWPAFDFTLGSYRALLAHLQASGCSFEPFNRWQGRPGLVSMRHDVDRLPGRALAMAQLEADAGVRATYFMRVKPHVLRPGIVERLSDLGHEVGYHYEDLPDANGDFEQAWTSFRRNLAMLRRHTEVTSIAMHGRPLSKWDSRALWTRFDYRSLGLSREAYLDIDWTQTCYFTDTGRAWNGTSNVRDRPLGPARPSPPQASTKVLADFVATSGTPAVISSHPERWTASASGWAQVYCQDKATSAVKWLVGAARKRD